MIKTIRRYCLYNLLSLCIVPVVHAIVEPNTVVATINVGVLR